MVQQNILLGGIVKEEVAKVNGNFTELYNKLDDMPTKTSDLTNDSNFVNTTQMNSAIEQACGGVEGGIPTKTSDLTNDSGFVNSTQMNEAITQATGAIDVPTKLSELTNDANYVKTTDSVLVNKVDKESGKGLSSNDYTAADKAKVAKLGKIDFTTTSFGTAQADEYFYATLPAAGKYPVKVMKANGSNYDEVMVQASVEGDNIVICSSVAFAGYVVTV